MSLILSAFQIFNNHLYGLKMGTKQNEGVNLKLTLSVPYVELVYLLSELILLNGLSARNRKREAPFKVLHLVHGAEEQILV